MSTSVSWSFKSLTTTVMGTPSPISEFEKIFSLTLDAKRLSRQDGGMSKPKKKWYISRDGKAIGPYSWRVMQDMADDGDLKPTELVCEEGGSIWVAAKDVPHLIDESESPAPPKWWHVGFPFLMVLSYCVAMVATVAAAFADRQFVIGNTTYMVRGGQEAIAIAIIGGGFFLVFFITSLSLPSSRLPGLLVFGVALTITGFIVSAGGLRGWILGACLVLSGVVAISAAAICMSLNRK